MDLMFTAKDLIGLYYATKEALEQEEREKEEMMDRINAEMTEDEWGPAL